MYQFWHTAFPSHWLEMPGDRWGRLTPLCTSFGTRLFRRTGWRCLATAGEGSRHYVPVLAHGFSVALSGDAWRPLEKAHATMYKFWHTAFPSHCLEMPGDRWRRLTPLCTSF